MFLAPTRIHSLLRTDITKVSPPGTWAEVIPQHPADLLQWASALKGDALVVCWLRNVCSTLELRSLETGELTRTIPLPGLGSVASFCGACVVEVGKEEESAGGRRRGTRRALRARLHPPLPRLFLPLLSHTFTHSQVTAT